MARGILGAYHFAGKDPAVFSVRGLIESSTGKKVNVKGVLKKIEEDGGPKVSTMRSWFFGKVRRPQNATIEACGRALGYERVWRKRKEK